MYDLKPKIKISDENKIITNSDEIYKKIDADKIIFECYHGVNYDEFSNFLKHYADYKIINIESLLISKDKYSELVGDVVTDDRVFGKMNDFEMTDFYPEDEIQNLQKTFDASEKIIVYGVGASLIKGASQTVYLDLARWEIQLRYRKGLTNFNMDNESDENITKFKIGYFLDWRVCDKIKRSLNFDYLLDTNNDYKLIHAEHYKEGLNKSLNMPFRLVPYFDPGVWGGNWMKEKFNLPENGSNYAWSFDGVVEENSVLLQYADEFIEIPAINVLFNNPAGLLGDHVYGIYGCEWPIRFDYLDTLNGQNLSLQVHPKKSYIKEKFNMDYTQDESYYIMDTKGDAVVYLGVKEDIDVEEFTSDLKKSENGDINFPADKYINRFEAKKHDHFSIPAGTVHCSGENVVVLEISATPYIFTFKLWDWDRVGLDGRPRPIHIEHGLKNIDFSRDTTWVEGNLISHIDNRLDIQETGLCKEEPIKTIRYKIKDRFTYQTENKCTMGNLVSGDSITIKSPNNEFEDYQVNYGETFIIPALINEVEFVKKNGNDCMVLLATIK